MAASLKEWHNKSICVVTSDGRMIVGTLLGHDQVQNLILTDAHERIYSEDADVEELPLGLYVIRGDNLCLVGEYDADTFADITIRIPAALPPSSSNITVEFIHMYYE